MDEGDDTHLPFTLGALKRVDLIDALDAFGPTTFLKLLAIVALLFFRKRSRGELSTLTSTPTKESTCVEDTRGPRDLQPSLRYQNTHKFHQYNQYSRVKKRGVNGCVTIFPEDRSLNHSNNKLQK